MQIQLEFICPDCKQQVRVTEEEKVACSCAGVSWGILPGVKVTRTEIPLVLEEQDAKTN